MWHNLRRGYPRLEHELRAHLARVQDWALREPWAEALHELPVLAWPQQADERRCGLVVSLFEVVHAPHEILDGFHSHERRTSFQIGGGPETEPSHLYLHLPHVIAVEEWGATFDQKLSNAQPARPQLG